tara:strand:+ start:416 stop:712 length:297 start_codon:yes stop_codon:yes gene_type:complete
MNLGSKPKVPATFDHLTPVEKASSKVEIVASVKTANKPWNTVELAKLINLRALKMTYKECGERIGRPANSCVSVIHTNDLYADIRKKRDELINGFLDG